MTSDAAEVRVYWRPGCHACSSLRVALGDAGVVADWHDIWQEPRARAFVRQVADGNETVPTLVVAGTAHVAPSPRRALDLIAEAAPHLVTHRRHWAPLRVVQWITVALPIVGSQALASAGHRSWSYAAMSVAVLTYWALRRLRARPVRRHPHGER
ncbi:MAG: hypothetical protein M3N25_00010 [Actinomycetota bacterium]|nr:hypothetical protein [Actinomycetota bacterium]